ncbi:hypothetical protein C5688_03925 [Methylocystis sp. MitZ-2018]|nr:hypothetical protein C5688_03925 [Methylocystis sp. MitZ-2018]
MVFWACDGRRRAGLRGADQRHDGRLDHAAFGRNRPNADNVIDSQSLERALCEKPVPTFSQRALASARRVRH